MIAIFGYPGCSADLKDKQMETAGKDLAEKKQVVVKEVLNKAQVSAAIFSVQLPWAIQTNFASFQQIITFIQQATGWSIPGKRNVFL